jgi:hypothetical protein
VQCTVVRFFIKKSQKYYLNDKYCQLIGAATSIHCLGRIESQAMFMVKVLDFDNEIKANGVIV